MQKLPRIIGLIGRKGAGKDTAADMLMVRGYENIKFAGALKDMLRALLSYQGVDHGTIERMVEGDLKEEPSEYLSGQTPRWAMQTLGTEWGRNLIANGLWVDVTIRRAMAGDQVVITDCRFPNEKEAIEKVGGVVLGITADWITPVEGEHESEALIDEMIANLPSAQRVTNHWAEGDERLFAIQDFQSRCFSQLTALGAALPA
ncbi:putative deoxynucleotide monophosphate kinase [Erythrobacter phage vB_EliS-L02]|nr:putative deoxynucleotide monophosphate kinase [Erythrobacter phage vB_EliS-L02]